MKKVKSVKDSYTLEPITLNKAELLGIRGKDVMILGETGVIWVTNLANFAQGKSLLKAKISLEGLAN